MNQQKLIAVADDDTIYVSAFKSLLKTWKITASFIFFKNGKELLDFMLIKEAAELPDILLLDLNMPVMNGWKFLDCFETSAKKLTKPMEIYLVSSSILEEDKLFAATHPLVKDLITKPMSKNKLKNLLDIELLQQ